MKARITSILNTPTEKAWAAVKQSKTLTYIAKGFLHFEGAENFPHEWVQGKTEQCRLIFFGFIPAWQHALKFIRIDNHKHQLFTEEAGGLIPQWNHLIKVEPLTEFNCRYTDEIDIKAGIATPLVWLYAHAFYRYRQHRWKKLIHARYFQVL